MIHKTPTLTSKSKCKSQLWRKSTCSKRLVWTNPKSKHRRWTGKSIQSTLSSRSKTRTPLNKFISKMCLSLIRRLSQKSLRNTSNLLSLQIAHQNNARHFTTSLNNSTKTRRSNRKSQASRQLSYKWAMFMSLIHLLIDKLLLLIYWLLL